jgi:hypothetical protein
MAGSASTIDRAVEAFGSNPSRTGTVVTHCPFFPVFAGIFVPIVCQPRAIELVTCNHLPSPRTCRIS